VTYHVPVVPYDISSEYTVENDENVNISVGSDDDDNNNNNNNNKCGM